MITPSALDHAMRDIVRGLTIDVVDARQRIIGFADEANLDDATVATLFQIAAGEATILIEEQYAPVVIRYGGFPLDEVGQCSSG